MLLENLKTPINNASDSVSDQSGMSQGIGDILQVQVDFAKLVSHLKKIKKGMSKQKQKIKDLKLQIKEGKKDAAKQAQMIVLEQNAKDQEKQLTI